MERFDTVIRGGMVIDGTRMPRVRADVGIRDGRIARIGRLPNAAADRVLDAEGLVVAPGFVDLHTHYDAQVFWDPYCTLSGWHGVTSVVIGNCGFGFAPVQPEMRERSMLSMTRVEAIAACTLRPAQLLGIEHERGTLRQGARADLVVLDEAGQVEQTWIGGERVI